MKRTYIYKQYTTDFTKHVIKHHIDLENGNPRGNWYRQSVSVQSFMRKILDRWYEKHLKGFKGQVGFGLYGKDEELNWLNVCKKYNIEPPKYENFYHNSVWDFYDFIKYDYKNRSVKQLDKFMVNF